jgi:transposase
MNKNFSTCWGIDVSKDWIDVAIDEQVYHIHQSKRSINSFIKKHFASNTSVLAVMESTGGYEQQAARLLDAHGICVHIAHPNKVKHFARAKGMLAKTDILDARILAQYGLFIDPKTIRALPSKQMRELRDYSSHLNQLKDLHHQETCRVNRTQNKIIQSSHKKIIKQLDKQIEAIQALMLALIKADAELNRKYELILSMKGIGPVVALTMIAELPELGEANKKEIAALVGVAPITQQSGYQQGKAMIRHGRGSVRKMLYMSSLSAIRFDKRMKTFYDNLVARGKPKKVALVAVMRKRLVILNTMMAKGEHYRELDY